MTKSTTTLGILLATSSLCAAFSVHAQEVEQAGDGLDEIIVTAQKKQQNLQDVPVAVTQIGGAQIRESRLESAADIQMLTPGLVVSYSSTNAIPNFSIRGVGLNDFTAVQSSPVAIHVDDVYQASSTLLNFALFDIERVEVLKGPQGTLYGRNSSGGAVNFFTNKPTENFEGSLRAGYANFKSFTTEGFLSGPLSGTLSSRVSFYYKNQDGGPYHHPTIGVVGKQEKFAVRGQLLWKPNDVFDARLTISGGSDKSDGNQYQGLGTIAANGVDICAPVAAGNLDSGQDQCFSLPPTTPGLSAIQSNDNDPFTLQSGVINRDRLDVLSATLGMNYDFSGVTLTSITGWAKSNRKSQEDADGTTLRAVDVGYENRFTQFSEELRLSSSDKGPLQWTLGAYYSHDKLVTPRTETDLADIFDGFRQNQAYDLKTDAFAVFSHNEYAVNDKLSLVAGIRYTDERRTFRGGTITVAPGVGPTADGDFVPSPTPVPDFGNAAAFDSAYINQSISFKKVSWRAGVNYDFTDDIFGYASVSNGFKSGGFVGDITVQSVLEKPYGAETLTAYEVGLKTTLFDRHVRWNSSLFYYDYRDVILAVDVIQNNATLNTLFTNANVSDAKVYGAETDLEWAVTRDLTVRLAGTYLDTRQHQTVAVVQAIDGSHLPYTPKWSGNATIRYRKAVTDTIDAAFQFDALVRSSHFAEAESTPLAKLRGYGLVNGSIGLFSEKGWSLNFWMKNITDKRYFTYLNDIKGLGTVIRTPGQPRTNGVDMSFKF
jgi:iron complex outermembrane receptor protein